MMSYILFLLIGLLVYWLGVLSCYLDYKQEKKILENKIDFYKNKYELENSKLLKIDMFIRKTRNDLLNKQTVLRNTPREKQRNKALDYIGTNANVRLITQLEEAIRNEMR